jgi:hypothetical protein
MRISLLLSAAAIIAVLAAVETVPAVAAPQHSGAVVGTDSVIGTDMAARRSRVTVRPRYRPGPNSVRQCRAWLAQEYRPSGTVIVPRQQCWWE